MFWLYALPFPIAISFVIGAGVRVIDTNSSFSILKMVWSISVPATKQNGKRLFSCEWWLIAQVMSECVRDGGRRNQKTFQQRKMALAAPSPTAPYFHVLHHFCNLILGHLLILPLFLFRHRSKKKSLDAELLYVALRFYYMMWFCFVFAQLDSIESSDDSIVLASHIFVQSERFSAHPKCFAIY